MKLLIIVAFVMLGCTSQDVKKEQPVEVNSKRVITENKTSNINEDTTKIENSIGVITLTDSYQFGEEIQALNEKKIATEPIIINEETEVLALKCLSIEGNFYKVVFDDGQIGFIEKNIKVKYQTWAEHVLNVFSLGFNPEKNPIKENPTESAQTKLYDENEFYHPVEIENDWIKIKWGSADNWEYGWIKWEYQSNLLVELFYFA